MSEGEHSGTSALGARLSEARQALNLATADVARRLKLSVLQVEALEAGRYHDLPGPIFVRGFIRNYAKLVKLDPDELLLSAADSLPQAESRPEMPPSQNIPFPTAGARRWPRYTVGATVIVALLAVYEFYVNQPAPTVAMRPVVVDPPSIKARQTEKAAKAPPRTAAAARQSRPAARPEVTAPIARHAAAAPDAAGVPQPPEQVASPEAREVRFVFDEESWVEVRDRNDRVILYQLNDSGTARRVSGLPPLSIVVGNAHGVRMTYDGQPVDLARHTKIDVARLTLE